MYIYNYIHIWRAVRNVKNPPANNYATKAKWTSQPIVVRMSLKSGVLKLESRSPRDSPRG